MTAVALVVLVTVFAYGAGAVALATAERALETPKPWDVDSLRWRIWRRVLGVMIVYTAPLEWIGRLLWPESWKAVDERIAHQKVIGAQRREQLELLQSMMAELEEPDISRERALEIWRWLQETETETR